MKRTLSLVLSLLLAVSAMALPACAAGDTVTKIQLSDSRITVDGKTASTDETAAVYTAYDIVFYLEGQGFTYGEGTAADEHTQAEADAHTVVHITEPGTYSISGNLSAGQIAVDLGKDAEDDPDAVVTLILNGVDITCTVAPAVIFYNVYECGSSDEEAASKDVDTAKAGANVVIADGTTNHVAGSYVARIYKSYTLSEDGKSVVDNKKLHKYDGAFYSKMSMNVDGGAKGTGVLTIDAENEGLDSELHLTINGGNINIRSGNDGINTNEDGVSVTTINGGTLNIQVTGETGEGDGIDSNGWLVINGGTITAAACSTSGDAGIDSDMGIHINGGTVAASGNMLDRIEAGGQNYAVFNFAARQSGGTACTLKDADGKTVGEWAPVNDYTYLIISTPDLEAGNYTLWQGSTQLACSASDGMEGGRGGMGGGRPDGGFQPPEGMEPPQDNGQRPEAPQDGQRPEGGGRFQPNADGTITLPDGTAVDPSQMTPPDGMGGPGGFGGQSGGQADGVMTKVFVLSDGGTQFSRVAPAGEDASDLPFSDVERDSWCYDAVKYTYDQGLLMGTSGHTFGTSGTLTRGQVVTILYRMAGSPKVSAAPDFTDVTADTWCADAVAWAAEEGLVEGYGDGTFRPDTAISRQQLAAMLYRYEQRDGGGFIGAWMFRLDFEDAGQVSDWAYEAMCWCTMNGIITGSTDGKLLPAGTATRAQTAAILQRYLTKA